MLTRFASILFVVVAACGGSSSGDDIAPDGSSVPGGEPSRFIVSRGVAGAETLYAVDGEQETALSEGTGSPWCSGKVFCNLPPNGSIGRFPFVTYVGVDRALYVQLDPNDWSQIRVVSVDVATGAITELAGNVTWPLSTPDWPVNYVVSAAQVGTTIWVSLPVDGGMGLFRTNGTDALELVDTAPIPAGWEYMESSIHGSASGLVWSVRWRNLAADSDPFAYRTAVLDATGAVTLHVPDDIAGAIDGGDESFVAGNVATIEWEQAGGELFLELVDLASGQRTPVQVAQPFVRGSCPGGEGVVLVGTVGGPTKIVDTTTGQAVDEISGTPYEVRDGRLLYRPDATSELIERVIGEGTERVVAPNTSIMIAAMGGARSHDGKTLAVGAGAPSFDLTDNTGIQLVDAATLATTDVEQPAVSEDFVRRMAWTGDDGWLVYLTPVDDVLQLAGFERASGTRAVLTTGSESVRQVVLP